jgi:hypothetical protein
MTEFNKQNPDIELRLGLIQNINSASFPYNCAQVISELLPELVLEPLQVLVQVLEHLPVKAVVPQGSEPFQVLLTVPVAIKMVSFEHRKDSPRR